jgi:hypothetical protein
MPRPLYTNNAQTTLATGITSTATSIQVASGSGSLFPNPSNQECQLFFPSSTHSIELLDGSGKRISTFEMNNENTLTISTLTLEEGFYLIRLIDLNGNSITKKLQVIH